MFTASLATVGIFGGFIADRAHRVLVIGIACIAWSSCTLLTGLIKSFVGLFIFRFCLGLFESVFNPCAYSIISDFFHPRYRTTANAVFSLGIFFGGALSSISLNII